MQREIRLAVVGLGSWARRAYLPNIALVDGVELAALCTRSEENLRAALKLVNGSPRCFNDYRALLDWGRFDGVIVATAAGSHREVAEAVLRQGFPVLCEKPLATSLEDCDTLIEVAGRANLPLLVGLEFRHAPICVMAAEMVRSGNLGQPTLLWSHVFRDKAEGVCADPERYMVPGGVFSEFLCHYLDLVSWFSNSTPITLDASAGRHLQTPSFDYGSVQIAFVNQMVASIAFSLFAPKCREQVHIGVVGDAGALDLDLYSDKLTLFSKSQGRSTETLTAPESHHPNRPYPGCYEQLVAFADSIRSGSSPVVDGAVGRNLLALTLAADLSAKEKRIVCL